MQQEKMSIHVYLHLPVFVQVVVGGGGEDSIKTMLKTKIIEFPVFRYHNRITVHEQKGQKKPTLILYY